MNPFKSEWLGEWEVFRYDPDNHYSDTWLIRIMSGMIIGSIGFILGSCISENWISLASAGGVGVLVAIVFATYWFWMPLLHPMRKINDHRLRGIAYAYWKLGKEDRKELPRNFIKVLKKADSADRTQRTDFVHTSNEIIQGINQKHKILAKANERHIDMSDAIAELSRVRESVEITNKTYKEYL